MAKERIDASVLRTVANQASKASKGNFLRLVRFARGALMAANEMAASHGWLQAARRLLQSASRNIARVALMPTSVIAACAATLPEVHVLGQLPRGVDPPVYVTAARQKEEITRALRAAGFHVVDRVDESACLLRVTIGMDQGSRPCGTLNNVRGELRVGGRTVVEVEAKGWTGSCEPNILDATSRELRRRIVELTTQEGQPK